MQKKNFAQRELIMSSNNKVTQNNTRPSASKSAGLIWSELNKVTWPTRKEAARLTVLVLIISGVIGAILSVIDLGFAELFKFLTEGQR